MIWRAAIFLTAIKALAILSIAYLFSKNADAGQIATWLLSALILPEVLLSPMRVAPTWGAALQAIGMAFLISFAVSTILVGAVVAAETVRGKG